MAPFQKVQPYESQGGGADSAPKILTRHFRQGCRNFQDTCGQFFLSEIQNCITVNVFQNWVWIFVKDVDSSGGTLKITLKNGSPRAGTHRVKHLNKRKIYSHNVWDKWKISTENQKFGCFPLKASEKQRGGGHNDE